MAALDWIFLAVLGASLLLGAWRGLVFELFSLAGWVLAFLAAQWFAADAGALLPLGGLEPAWRHAAGFALVFVGTVFAAGLAAWLVRKLVEAVGLRPADRALGALFGVLRGVVLLLAATLVASWTQGTEAPWWRESRGAPVLEGALASLRPSLPQAWGGGPPLPAW